MLLSALYVSASGLRAESRSVQATASNVANMHSSSRLADAEAERAVQSTGQAGGAGFDGYKPFRVDRFAVLSGGVRAEFREAEDFYTPAFDPSDVNADADTDGVVALPNVRSEEEIVNLAIAKRAYSANLGAFRTSSEMLGELLDDES